MLQNVSEKRETNSSTTSVEKQSGRSPEDFALGNGSCDFLSPQEIYERLKVTATAEQLRLHDAAIPHQGVDSTTKVE